CQPRSGMARHARAYGVATIPLRMRAPYDVSALVALVGLIRREAIHLVHTHSSIDSWLGGMAARLTGRPVVRSRHVSVPVRNGWNPVYSLLADRILTSGQAVRRLLVRAGVRPGKIVSLPAGVDFDRFRPGVLPDRVREEFQLAWPVLGSVAMFRGSKGHLDLLDAFALVRFRFPQAKLLFVGDGGRRPMVEAVARERELKDAVIFTGFREDVAALLSAMDVFVLASTRTEGVPQSLVQAMAMKVPVVATATGGIPEVVEDGKTGLLVKPRDPHALASALEASLGNPDAARERAERARDLVSRHYSRDAAMDRLEVVYRSLLQR
ncbi:MAG TPA: glycosyltransferase, partial [Methylomirabilota bacterium]|nr:glycosyltransferase [Methylomirabilota bacterium]